MVSGTLVSTSLEGLDVPSMISSKQNKNYFGSFDTRSDSSPVLNRLDLTLLLASTLGVLDSNLMKQACSSPELSETPMIIA